jgi:hypothetical protein
MGRFMRYITLCLAQTALSTVASYAMADEVFLKCTEYYSDGRRSQAYIYFLVTDKSVAMGDSEGSLSLIPEMRNLFISNRVISFESSYPELGITDTYNINRTSGEWSVRYRSGKSHTGLCSAVESTPHKF